MHKPKCISCFIFTKNKELRKKTLSLRCLKINKIKKPQTKQKFMEIYFYSNENKMILASLLITYNFITL